MKKLLIIRHAKAAHPDHTNDFDRPLTHSGEKDAKALGKRLGKEGLVPGYLVSSDALRARTTAAIVAEQVGMQVGQLIHDIYEASEKTVLRVINQLPDEYDFIALTGHNPGLSYIVSYLTGDYCNLSTSAAVLISFDTERWGLISADFGRTIWYHEPED